MWLMNFAYVADEFRPCGLSQSWRVLRYEEELLDFPRPLSLAMWLYFLISQVVLLNLLVAIMGDTWQRVKDSADVEWKYLLVQVWSARYSRDMAEI